MTALQNGAEFSKLKPWAIAVRIFPFHLANGNNGAYSHLVFLIIQIDVAAAGLPDPRPDHAIVMARFARDCSLQFQALTQQLEVSLGMGTSDLSIRVGLHSGPVTAGVLRGDKSRFQLFGKAVCLLLN